MPIITIAEAAEISNKSQKTIRRAIASGKLKSVKIQNKTRIERNDFEKWLKTGFSTNAEYEKPIQRSEDVNWVDISDIWKTDGWKRPKERINKNFIDLFAGAGGLSCGMVMAGFNPIATVEIMPQAVETYEYNFCIKKKFDEKVETRDIRNIEVKEKLYNSVKDKKVDVIVGGFPCQGFSMAGYRVVDDPRNSLYKEMKEIVEHLKPEIVIMENVEGLRSMLNGKVEEMILDDYKKIGYDMNLAVLNSANYGVAQFRKRVIFIGNRINKKNLHPAPLYNESNYISLGKAIRKYMNMEERYDINHVFTKHTQEMVKRLSEVPEGKSLYKNYSDSWKKSPWNKPSCTIKENHGGTNIHPKLPRCLTARELATLQSFPEDFIFKGTKKWQLVQIGNAVPPLLGKAVGLAVRKMFDENK